jgi:hypothetical protein
VTAAAAAAAPGPAPKVPRHVLVAGHKIHLRHAQQILWVVIITTLGTAAVSAVYYLVTQVDWNVAGHHLFYLKPGWDNLVHRGWWPFARHQIRDVGEGVIAAFGVHTFLVGSWRKHIGKPLTGLALAARAGLVAVCTLALMAGGICLTTFVLPQSFAATTGGQFDWETLALGFVIVHIVRLLWVPVGSTISTDFIEGAVYRAHGRTPFWVRRPVMPPSVREEFSWVQANVTVDKPRFDLVSKILQVAVILLVPLAVYGEYVLHVIARN